MRSPSPRPINSSIGTRRSPPDPPAPRSTPQGAGPGHRRRRPPGSDPLDRMAGFSHPRARGCGPIWPGVGQPPPAVIRSSPPEAAVPLESGSNRTVSAGSRMGHRHRQSDRPRPPSRGPGRVRHLHPRRPSRPHRRPGDHRLPPANPPWNEPADQIEHTLEAATGMRLDADDILQRLDEPPGKPTSAISSRPTDPEWPRLPLTPSPKKSGEKVIIPTRNSENDCHRSYAVSPFTRDLADSG